jgi:hypothetical protein
VAPANTFAVCPIDREGEAAAVTGAVQRGASAVLLYRERTPELYLAALPDGALPVPCVTIRPADGLQLAKYGVLQDLVCQIDSNLFVMRTTTIGMPTETAPSKRVADLLRRCAPRDAQNRVAVELRIGRAWP